MVGTIDLEEEMLQGQADIWRFIYAFADSMALKSAVELRIAEIIHSMVFAIQHPSNGGEPLYDLTHSSKWILHDSKLTLAPQIMAQTHPWLMAPWTCFSRCMKVGGVAFKKAHGSEI
ncbi:O-methyltransferase, family 2 [Corchorus olitorius]|uniref:O-methyltransferase, family 2 n=1 Tax=Corchorus olitorius TaxID=93759 RepID=A0A1R3GH80_9ROSI|nr:O-methyltransferase, family 2 [Corchorus olitorius]